MPLQERFSDHFALRDPHKGLLLGIRELAPEITARAGEIEAARRLPPDLVERLKSIGLFRMFVPRSHGGLELDLPEGMEVMRALTRLDGSIGTIVYEDLVRRTGTGWRIARRAVIPRRHPLQP